jgi:hypothetical protein
LSGIQKLAISPEEYLAPFPPKIQQLASQLRPLIPQTVPNISEAVYPGWQLIGYRVQDGRRNAYFAYIAPTPEWVMLGFEYGVLLDDPHGLLQGNGRQVRHVVIEEPADIRPAELIPLIRQAAEVALASKEQKKQWLFERDARIDAERQR